MNKILLWLSGKKSIIGEIIGVVLIFCLGRDWIAQDVAQLISLILLAIGVPVSIATGRMYKKIK